ncbi:alpha-mannosyltransferase [Fusarium oxysporum f. sp. phaseoli]
MPVFHANGSSMFTNGGIPQGQTLYFPTTVIPSQFIDATDTNQLVPSTPYGNAHFAPQNAPFYSSLDLSFARCYSTTPVGACFHVFPCSAHGWLDYSFTGMSSSAVSQQFSSFPLPAISNHTNHGANLLQIPVREKATSTLKALPVEDIFGQPDFLDELICHDDLEEAAQPEFIRTPLKRQGLAHQKQALTFMLKREEGWGFSDKEPGVWEIADTEQGRLFVNRVSNTSQSEEPIQCYGDILADPMGFGKTLAMMALVATDLQSKSNEVDTSENVPTSVLSTLIVVPPSLMGTWKEQLSEHVEDGLRVYLYHGNGRLLSKAQLESCGIVLTTYQTIAAEWSRPRDSQSNTMFSVRWRRIILDEAHTVRNKSSKVSRAVCALEARSYWAVTGTPIQNRLDDLATLFTFIRAHPYTDRKCFDVDVSRLWKERQPEEAIRRLRLLLRCLMLRRSKAAIRLPPREDIRYAVNLDPEERAVYNQIRCRIFEDVKKDHNLLQKRAKNNVFQKIISLRRVCSLGSHYEPGHTMGQQSSECENGETVVQSIFKTQLESSLPGVLPQTNKGLPSKVVALITDIKAREVSEKCIVFSEWTRTLELIENGLSQSGIQSIRFDGGVPPKDRMQVIKQFREHSSIRVLLLTLACGANGLTLTAASRAYIMEPQWNPSVEEQALARIHRIGQEREVTTVRFFVSDSFEEVYYLAISRTSLTRAQNVMKKQESKKHLAGLLLSPHNNEQATENPERLHDLLSLI